MVKTSRDDVWKASPAAGTVGPVLRDTSSPGAALTSGHRLSLNITRSFSPSSGGQEAVTRVLRGAVPNRSLQERVLPASSIPASSRFWGPRSPSPVAVALQSLPPSSHGLLCAPLFLINHQSLDLGPTPT